MHEPVFKKANFDSLSESQKSAIQATIYALNGDDESSWQVKDNWGDDELTESLELLGPAQGCVPEGYEENLDQNIIRKLRGLYGAARTMAVELLRQGGVSLTGTDFIYCHVEPSCEDSSNIIIHDDDHVYYSTDRKAWNVTYDSLEDLANEVLEVRDSIIRRWWVAHP